MATNKTHSRANAQPEARRLRLALAQINVTVGALTANVARIEADIRRANALGAQVVCFPELSITGYPPEDLLLKVGFVADNLATLDQLTAFTQAFPGLTVIVGYVHRDGDLYNAAAILREGRCEGIYRKQFLPNYGVFDEDRYFGAGSEAATFLIDGVNVGCSICEDIWIPGGPPTLQAESGAEVLINISASPYFMGKRAARERMLATRAADTGAIVAYLNLVGGQDELIFDGSSLVFDGQGELIARAKAFEEDLLVVNLDVDEVFRTRLHDPRRRNFLRANASRNVAPHVISTTPNAKPLAITDTDGAATTPGRRSLGRIEPRLSAEAEAYQALTLGVRDYVGKNGFTSAVMGLSGGIDSALTAAIAVDALGAEHVTGVSMPSRYSSSGSRDDAALLAKQLGVRYLSLPIEEMFAASLATLETVFSSTPSAGAGLAQENLQARMRGALLMAFSNASGAIVLTTGNKSEMAVGYATLYGDMAGGFAVLKDVYKTLVYRLARWRNAEAGYDLIPTATIEKAPSAELRPDQRDTDSLPPYDALDQILAAYVEDDWSFEDLAQLGYDADIVRRVMKLVDMSEYKRRQAPPGIKITERAFGRDRRLPITNAYRGVHPPFGPAARASDSANGITPDKSRGSTKSPPNRPIATSAKAK